MAHPLRWTDTLRIERTVWTLDTLLADLPGRRRRSIRRDIRANLRAAAAEVGTAEALHRLGSVRRIAIDYLDAEYGEHRPRPSVRSGIYWGLLVEMVLLGVVFSGFQSFIAGVEAANPAPGTYVWDGMKVLGGSGEVTFDEDGFAGFSYAVHLWFFAYPLGAVLIGGRMWRAVPAWWQARRADRRQPAKPEAVR